MVFHFVFTMHNLVGYFKLNKNEYSTREKVELELTPLLARRDSVNETLSVSVVNAGYFNSVGGNQSIQSYLLLDSELKGSIESPASYFMEEENISIDEKLDLVMMINGWRSDSNWAAMMT